MTKHLTTALVYTRVSRLDDDERERKVSPAMQCERAAALGELRGLILERFEDLDISGKDAANRPGYLAMLRRLEAGDVRYVVAYDQSRITRNVGDLQRFREAIARAGALFIESSTGRVLDPDDEDQELGSNVIGSVDQHYRRKLARRLRDALATKAGRGELVGPVPAGYVRRRKVLENGHVARTWVEVDPEPAAIVRTIFTEYATGAYSFKSLARALNVRGLRPPRRADAHVGRGARPAGALERASLFTSDVLKDLLGNPRYMGWVPVRGRDPVRGVHEPLVTEEIWRECERVRLRNTSTRLQLLVRSGSRYLLSGVLRCASCGSTMSGQTFHADPPGTRRGRGGGSHRTTRYRYTCYQRRVGGACTATSLDQAALEDELLEVLALVALPAGFADAIDSAVEALEPPTSAPRAGSPELRSRLGRLRELYELGDLTRDEYFARREQLQAKLEAPRTRSHTELERNGAQLRRLVDEWDEMTIDEKRSLIAVVFPAVYAAAEGLHRLRPHPDWLPYIAAAAAHVAREAAARSTPDVVRNSRAGSSPVFRSVRSRAPSLGSVPKQ